MVSRLLYSAARQRSIACVAIACFDPALGGKIMLDEVALYLGAHPAQLTAIGLAIVLAGVGLWYVLAHHLQAIIVTVLSAAGVGSGLLVLYRGYKADMSDLVAIGLFLIVIFPVIFWQAIKQLEPTEPVIRTGRRAVFSRKARS
jgi:hypothetical protein